MSQEFSAHEFYDAIGRVAVEGAEVERSLVELIFGLTNSEAFRTYAYGSSLGTLIDMCRIAASRAQISEDDARAVSEVLNRASTLKSLRDKVVHAQWTPMFEPDSDGEIKAIEGQFVGARARLRRPFQDEHVPLRTPGEIREVAAQLYVLKADIFQVNWNLHPILGKQPTGYRVVTPHGSTRDGRGIGEEEAARRRADEATSAAPSPDAEEMDQPN
jgi:hypothetical protein